jgi:hypothetical protein
LKISTGHQEISKLIQCHIVCNSDPRPFFSRRITPCFQSLFDVWLR